MLQCLCECVCVCSNQWRLIGAVQRRAVEDDVVLHQHGYGPQDEGEEEVEVDVVPSAVQFPVDVSR